MKIADILTLEHTLCDVSGVSKKRVLEHLSALLHNEAAFSTLDPDAIYHKLLERERLGSTGIGSGVAIPHCRVEGCPKITGVLLKLTKEIDFDAIDGKPVDLVFALIVPEEQTDDHLKALAAIAQLMQDETCRNQLRKTHSNEALFKMATTATIQ
jgi:PTS system nitrogen regulatory IIA component